MPTLIWHASWPFRRLFGCDLGYLDALATPAPKAVYGEALSLFGLLFTNGAALTISQQRATEPPQWLSLLPFAFVVVFVIIGAMIMLNAKHKTEASPKFSGIKVRYGDVGYAEKAKHAYERGSISLLRTVVGFALVAPPVFLYLVLAGQLPGQDFVVKAADARFGEAKEVPLDETKTVGLMQPIELAKSDFPRTGGEIPRQVNMEVTLTGLAKKWKVQEVLGFWKNEKGKWVEMEFQPAPGAEDPNTHKTLVLLEMMDSDKQYKLEVYLNARGKDQAKADVAEGMKLLRARQGMKVNFFTKAPEKKDGK